MLSSIGQSNGLTMRIGCLHLGIDKIIRQPRGINDSMQRTHFALRSTIALIRLQQQSLNSSAPFGQGHPFDHGHPRN
jgi:hypothetical protein